MSRIALAVSLLALGVGCQCGPSGTSQVDPADLHVSPEVLKLPAAWVGQTVTAPVSVDNLGGATADAPVTIDAPFTVDAQTISLGRGETATLTVSYAPTTAEMVNGFMHIGDRTVSIQASSQQPPVCDDSNPCTDSHFDFALGACVHSNVSNGSTCTTNCVTAGSCTAGTCVGAAKECPHADACSVGVCSEADGCSEVPVVCPEATAPCQVAFCSPTSGCGFTQALDGTVCGVDDCAAVNVEVCIQGACTSRQRPSGGRCSNTWVRASIFGRAAHAMAYDERRHKVVLFGGATSSGNQNDTWEFDGSTWTLRTPVSSPSARAHHAMTWDPVAQRVVLFGGLQSQMPYYLDDLWEWDGTTWVERHTTMPRPSARYDLSITFDIARRRLVLFGGMEARGTSGGVSTNALWEPENNTWTLRVPTTTIHHLSKLAYDPVRKRVVLFGQHATVTNNFSVWEWDGNRWTMFAGAPTVAEYFSLAWHAGRREVVLLGLGGGAVPETWAWNGSTWSPGPPGPAGVTGYFSAMAYDSANSAMVIFGGTDLGPPSHLVSVTSLLTTSQWSALPSSSSPGGNALNGLTAGLDGTSLLGVGGRNSTSAMSAPLAGTWLWSNSQWATLSPAAEPMPRNMFSLATDTVRHRAVLFGGRLLSTGLSNETWEFDGTTWSSTATGPVARNNALMAFDAQRQRTVLFGGRGTSQSLNDTWEWNGVAWAPVSTTVSPNVTFTVLVPSNASLTWSSADNRLTLFNAHSAGMNLWQFVNSDWVPVSQTGGPTFNDRHFSAFDPDRNRFVLVGGRPPVSTWEWDGATWLQRAPEVSPTAAGLMERDRANHRITMVTGHDTWVFLP